MANSGNQNANPMLNMAMFNHLKSHRDITAYNLFHGTTDFTQLAQFDYYEQGFPYLIVLDIPEFMKKLAAAKSEFRTLINNYIHILEYEFTGLQSGLENMQADTGGEINNGYQTLNYITKVNAQSASTFTMTYKERSGSILTRAHELYLRSIRDPNNGLKTYGGLIVRDSSVYGYDSTKNILAKDAGYSNECFTFLYMHTDNTGLLLERSAILAGCMPTTAQLDIYNGTRGEITVPEISVEFTGIPVMGEIVDEKATAILKSMNDATDSVNRAVHRVSWNYEWNITKEKDSATQRSGSLYKAAKNASNVMPDRHIQE